MRVCLLVSLATLLGACANNSFSGSGSDVAAEVSSSGSAGTDNSGTPSGTETGTSFIADGYYYSLQYKTACPHGGPISIILVSNSGSQAALTRQSCVDLSSPVFIDPKGIAGTNATTINYAGEIFILGQN